MYSNPVAENVFGAVGTFLWSFQLVPQIVKSHRKKSTEGLSAWLLFIWLVGSVFQGAYLIIQDVSIPLILQPQLFGLFACIALAQCWHFAHRRSVPFCLGGTLLLLCSLAGIECGLTFGARHVQKQDGSHGATEAFGIVGTVLILGGLLPQYYEIFRFKEVKGISFVFLAIDMSGAVASCLSLVFKTYFDGVAASNYIGIFILESGICIIALILNPRARRRRLEQQQERSTSSASDDASDSRADGYAGRQEKEMEEARASATAMDRTPSLPLSETLTSDGTLIAHSNMETAKREGGFLEKTDTSGRGSEERTNARAVKQERTWEREGQDERGQEITEIPPRVHRVSLDIHLPSVDLHLPCHGGHTRRSHESGSGSNPQLNAEH